jgi:diguanylate cyclase
LGGEEFGILLIGNQQPQIAEAFIEGIRAIIESLAIPHEMSERGVVTASFGLVVLLGDSRAMACPEDVYIAADNLLYEAKARGRNCVVAQTM